MPELPASTPLPRWVCALSLLQTVIAAALLTVVVLT